jgi:hypothetical protein
MSLGREQVRFSTRRIEEAGFPSTVVFLPAKASQMHDSLPLKLFSPETLAVIFRNNFDPEFAMAPWCLLTASLTIREISTRTRVELLEIGFLFLYFYWRLRSHLSDPPRVVEKVAEGHKAMPLRHLFR